MVTRRKVLEGGALAALVTAIPFGRGSRAFGQTATTFDYYISPTGDDNNPGTLASPWSITALNSNQALYAGKRIGLLPGTYQHGTKAGAQTTLFSMMQAQSYNGGVILAIQGGPSSSQPTLIASSDSSGNYSPRTAIIDCSDPVTGAKPTTSSGIMGQIYGNGERYLMSQYGNTTIDGLVLRNFTYGALVFAGNGSQYLISGLTIQNCEIYDGQNVISNNNPGAIWIQYGRGVAVSNCLIHDLSSSASGSSYNMQAAGYIQFNSFNTSITNCTFYNCYAISNKDGFQHMDVSYCYCGWGTFGQPYTGASQYSGLFATIQNFLTGSGYTAHFHHNIVLGPMFAWGESGQANEGTVLIYNNTFYKPSGIGGHDFGLNVFTDQGSVSSGGTGNFQFYNNLVYAADAKYETGYNYPGAFTKLGAKTGGTASTLTNTDYNAYGVGMTFGQDFSSGDTQWSLATWRGYGYDAHSMELTTSPFTGTPTEADYTTFAISGPATTAGKGGVACGAVDGSGRVGCDFAGAAAPNPPVVVSVS